MHRHWVPLFWPIVSGVLLAIVLLELFPGLLGGNPAQRLAEPTSESAYVPISSPDISREAPEIIEAPLLGREQGPVSYSSAVEQAAPAVVNIYSSRMVEPEEHPLMSDPFFNQFFGDDAPRRQRMLSSLGSGVIVSPEGYVLTNHHVIRGADEIQVALKDGRETLAKLVGSDPESDLAVLKIDLANLPVIALSNSEQAAVGDVVLAIGNPFGFGQTVTMGIISALGRNHLGLNAYEDFIQTDAAINPGNSGGALINSEGALVGINTAIFSRSGGSQGIGFAIPTNLAREVLDAIVTQGRVIRGWLGIQAQEMTSSLATSFGLNALRGVVVTSVQSGGPAAQAGLQTGDVLLEIDAQPIIDAREAMTDIAEIDPGTSLPLKVMRDGEIKEFTVTVGERPAPSTAGSTP